MKIQEVLQQTAHREPERPAVRAESGDVTFAALAHGARDLAAALTRRADANNHFAGRLVGVLGRSGAPFVAAAFGALEAGAVVVPFSPDMREEDFRDTARRTKLAAVIHDNSAPWLRNEGERLNAFGPGPLHLLPLVPRATPSDLLTHAPDAAFVRFTSGTTGAPKGAVLTHRNVTERVNAAGNALGITAEDRVLWVLPMAYHFFVTIVLYLQRGASIIVAEGHSPDSLLRSARAHDATILYAAPEHYHALAFRADDGENGFGSALRLPISTASGLPADTARAFARRYGQTPVQACGVIEVGLALANLRDSAQHPESVGRPLPGCEAMIADARANGAAPAPDGETGRLLLRGSGMFSGYWPPWRGPAQVLTPGGWFDTGDLAWRDEATGLVTIRGRAATAVRAGDRLVCPEEIEAVLAAHPGIHRCRVRPLNDRPGCFEAEITPFADCPAPDPDDLLSRCRERLDPQLRITTIRLVGDVAQTPSGKVLRR